jgi:hypothetical protein
MYVTRISRYIRPFGINMRYYWYYPWFHLTAIGLGKYYPWLLQSACTFVCAVKADLVSGYIIY